MGSGASSGEVDQRRSAVSECYETLDLQRALEIIRQYDVRYIYVGPYERLYYSPRGLAKFSEMEASGWLDLVFSEGGVKIYEVTYQ
jgi:uncharacterized membrane protein